MAEKSETAVSTIDIYANKKWMGELTSQFLRDGQPPHRLKTAWTAIKPEEIRLSPEIPMTLNERLLALLGHPDMQSHASGATIQKGGASANVSDTLAKDFDPHKLAWAAIDRAICKLVAAGADPNRVTLAANIYVENADAPEPLGWLTRCVQGCFEAAVSYKTPFTASKGSQDDAASSANDRLHILAKGGVTNGRKKVTGAWQQAGNFVFVLGDSRAELGGSHFNQLGGRAEGSRTAPKPVPESLHRMQLLHEAMQTGIVQACRACGAGGIAVALAQLCVAGNLGLELQLIHVPRDWHAAYSADPVILFAESLGRFLVEVRPEDAGRFREMMADLPHECVAVVGGEWLVVNGRIGQPILNLSLAEMA
jgi:phosphoribosylformylglycinamidine synthase